MVNISSILNSIYNPKFRTMLPGQKQALDEEGYQLTETGDITHPELGHFTGGAFPTFGGVSIRPRAGQTQIAADQENAERQAAEEAAERQQRLAARGLRRSR